MPPGEGHREPLIGRGIVLSRYVDVDIYFGKKKVRLTGVIVFCAVVFALACIAILVLIPGRGILTTRQGRQMLARERYVIHAGGNVTDDGGRELSYTNSMEALQNCYDQGNRVAEFDLMVTSDDEVVCAHDNEDEDAKRWASEVDDAGWQNNPPTKETFLNAKYAGTLTTMSLDDLAAFMNEHADFYVVTDVKDDNREVCSLIRERYPKLSGNFIIQIYHEDEYDMVKKLGFNNIIYTLYRAEDEELEKDRLIAFIRDNNLLGVTFWAEFQDQYSEEFEAMKELGIPLFVHTINDMNDMKRYIEMGVTGIYTDVTDKGERYEQ